MMLFLRELTLFLIAAQPHTESTYENHLWIYGGIDAGFVLQDVNKSKLNELNKKGYQLDLKFLVSRSWNHFTLDGGLGFLFNDLYGNSSSALLTKDNVQTTGFFGELGARYRLSDFWELGPMLHLVFGNDVGFNSTGSKDVFKSFGGAQLLYRFNYRWPMRATFSALTDFDISNRQNYMALLGIQIGIPIWNFYKSKPSHQVQLKKTPVARAPKKLAPRPKAELSVPLETRALNFEINKFELNENAKTYFKQLGSYLNQNSDLWNEVEIEGHTDTSGSKEFNTYISQKRAEAVKTALIAGGLPEDRVSTAAYGSRYLAIPEDGRDPRNRRVELAFDKVKNSRALEKEIQRLQKKYLRVE